MNEKVMYIFYIISGVIVLLLSLLTYILKKKTHLLLAKSSCDVFWSLNFFFKGGLGFAGVIQNILAIIRDLSCYAKEKKIKFFDTAFYLFLMIIMFILVPILSWSKVGWYSLLPMFGSMFSALSLFTDNIKLTRILTIPAQGLCLAYSIIIFNMFGIVAYSFMILSAIIGLIFDKINLLREDKRL